MRHLFCALAVLALGFTAVPVAAAADASPLPDLAACTTDTGRHTPWSVDFGAMPTPMPAESGGLLPANLTLPYSGDQASTPKRVVPFEYSDGYKTRAKIHKIASVAMLPLFAGTWYMGQKVYDSPGESESDKGIHGFLGVSTATLFGVNSVTGIWNLMEARKDPNHKMKRTIHGILMLAADAGFVAAAATIPDSEGSYQQYTAQRGTHRTIAISSMAIATVGYLMMLFH